MEVLERSVQPKEIAACKPPAIGSRHLHKGGNIWEVTRYQHRSVKVTAIDDPKKVLATVDKGFCVYLHCLSASGQPRRLEDIPWPLADFHTDFEPVEPT